MGSDIAYGSFNKKMIRYEKGDSIYDISIRKPGTSFRNKGYFEF